MKGVTGLISISGHLTWQIFGGAAWDERKGVSISFPLVGKLKDRDALRLVKGALEKNDVAWLTCNKGVWTLHTELLKEQVPEVAELNWLRGDLTIEPEIDHETREVFGESRDETIVSCVVTEEVFRLSAPRKIFLSHKGSDKQRVRGFKTILEELGCEPWLDEDAMVAGENPDRAILRGFEESCAAVFFITRAFSDEGYLANEIEHAVEQKRHKGAGFRSSPFFWTMGVGIVEQYRGSWHASSGRNHRMLWPACVRHCGPYLSR